MVDEEAAFSVPPSGGAVRGLGESFTPDLHTGTGNLSIPLELPPGRNGRTPDLNLTYSTGSANGPFGLGWNLGPEPIRRKTTRGVPLHDDHKDVFLLAGQQDLVPVARVDGSVTHYRPRVEGLFALIAHVRTATEDYWRVQTRDGVVAIYGTPGASTADPAVVADPDERRRIAAWHLARTADPLGNVIEYSYDRDAGSDGDKRWDQVYLSEVRYADHGDAADGAFLVRLRLAYAARPDPFRSHRNGFEVRTTRRCVRVDVVTSPALQVMRSYHLDYVDQLADGPQPANEVSLLARLRVEGRDGAKSQWLPPIGFDYTRFEPGERRFISVEGEDLPADAVASPDHALIDLTGDGLPDLLELGSVARFWPNRGGGRFGSSLPFGQAPPGVRLGDPGVRILDADGDGRPDLMVSKQPVAGIYPLRAARRPTWRRFRPTTVAPSFNLDDPEVRLVDIDGDGVTDAVRSGTRLECFLADGEGGWSEVRTAVRGDPSAFPDVAFSDPRVRWADMTGDGLTDVVLLHKGSIEYWPSKGRGAWGRRTAMRHSPRLPEGYASSQVLLGDIDGDGLADLVYVGERDTTVWINCGGLSWSKPVVIEGTPPLVTGGSVRLVDLLGGGVDGVLWTLPVTQGASPRLFFLDFTGAIKPYLLSGTDNHRGAVTRIDYASSTRYALADEQRRETRWLTSLPFPVQVVARTQTIDAISGGKLTSSYAYHHGAWDGDEREFRGFGRVDQRDTESFDAYNATTAPGGVFGSVEPQSFSPPSESRTWFHVGPLDEDEDPGAEPDFRDEYWADDPPLLERPARLTAMLAGLPRRQRRDALRALRGNVLRSEVYAIDGSSRQSRPYSVTETSYDAREEVSAATAPLGIFFAYPVATRDSRWDRGSEPLTRLSFNGDYDAFGQPRSGVAIAVPRWRALTYGSELPAGESAPEPYLATHTRTDYAAPDPGGPYIVDRIARVTTYEIVSTGREGVLSLGATITGGSLDDDAHVISQSITFYDGPAFTGLLWGRAGKFGAPTRVERLVATKALLTAAAGGVLPPYLVAHAPTSWTAEYPAAFRSALPLTPGADATRPGLWSTATGLGVTSAAVGPFLAAAYYAAAERRRYDFHGPIGKGRGLVVERRDPMGRSTRYEYAFDLQASRVTNALSLVRTAQYDPRTLKPRLISDENGNRTFHAYTPLGLLESSAQMGRPGEALGDTPAAPSLTVSYEFPDGDAGPAEIRPTASRTRRRVHHVQDAATPAAGRDDVLEIVDYSDGFGRLVQTRTRCDDVLFGGAPFGDSGLAAAQASPAANAVGFASPAGAGPRVAVSGRNVYDNKGRVVAAFEPFYDNGWDYRAPSASQTGVASRILYDAAGRVVRRIRPDGAEVRTVFGVPGSRSAPDLSSVDHEEPTPWETYAYDENDNAGRTVPLPPGAATYASHWDTPASAVIDALGRVVQYVTRNGPAPGDRLVTSSRWDARGNLIASTDALGRVAVRNTYDLAGRVLHVDSMDAGLQQRVVDAASNEIERRDAKGGLVLQAFDAGNRPSRLWARDAAGEPVTLREHIVYGDAADSGLSAAVARSRNLLGALHQHYDEAGLFQVEMRDFKGNTLERFRRFFSDAVVLSGSRFTASWQPAAGTSLAAHSAALLDPREHRSTVTYDGVNRVSELRYPANDAGQRRSLRPLYNAAGMVRGIELDGATVVRHVGYDARGRRLLVAYGNGLMTRYAYDRQSSRVLRVRTERFQQPSVNSYHPTGPALQDLAYACDTVGNVTAVRERAPNSGVPGTLAGSHALDRVFTYDPLYRLQSATGREADDVAPSPPWLDALRSSDATLTRSYTETYTYDDAGNLTRLHHQATPGAFTRDITFAANSNHMGSMQAGSVPFTYTRDLNGNVTSETSSRHFAWDHGDRLKTFQVRAGASPPSVDARYLYGAGGKRVKKVVRKGAVIESAVYIDGVFEAHRRVQGASTASNCEIHVMDGERRIMVRREGSAFADDSRPATTYHLADHLESSVAIVDGVGALVNWEEYTPYGETSFGGVARKRYRYTGKERDEESGLACHGARFYQPWAACWLSPDPAGIAAGLNLYTYVHSRPMNLIDQEGRYDTPVTAAPVGTASVPPPPPPPAPPPYGPPPPPVKAVERPIQATAPPPPPQLPAAAAPPDGANDNTPLAGVILGGIINSESIIAPGTPSVPFGMPGVPEPPIGAPGAATDVAIKTPGWEYMEPKIAPGAGTPAGGATTGAASAGTRVGARVILGTAVSVLGAFLFFGTMFESDNQALTRQNKHLEDVWQQESQIEAECAGKIKQGQTHDHHVFPRQYKEEFFRIGIIDVDQFTISIPADKHIGKKGIHTILDYNGEWYDFFYNKPLRQQTLENATRLATELLDRAGLLPKRGDLHWYDRKRGSFQ